MKVLSRILVVLIFLIPKAKLYCDSAVDIFSTNGHTIYHLKPATVDDSGKRAVISAAYDGTVLCHYADGTLIWKSQTGGFFPNHLEVSDLDNDGLDESLVASADGSLYVFNDRGKLLWKFSRETPLLNVCVLSYNNSKIILTGGIERVIYAFSPEGKILNTFKTQYALRFIRKGNLFGDGKEYAAVVLAKGVRGRNQYYLQVFDPVNLEPVWDENVNISKEYFAECYFDMEVCDIDNDGKDDIILSHGWRSHGKLTAYNYKGEVITLPEFKWDGIPNLPYRMNMISYIKNSSLNDEYLLGLFGHQLIQYNLDLTVRSIFNTTYSYSNSTYDPQTNTYFMGSSISGGDCIYALHLDKKGWEKAYENLQAVGKLSEIVKNFEKLRNQIDNFKKPDYQPESREISIISRIPDKLDASSLKNVKFASRIKFNEDYDRSNLKGIWKTKKEVRFEYNDTREKIIAYAKKREKTSQNFTVWAGHGNDPYYMQMETIKEMIKTAPNTLKALTFGEMSRTDEPMEIAVKDRIIPLAEFCRQHNKKIIFLNKSPFWFTSCHLDFWKKVLLNGKYSDIFVSSTEETNDRLQDLCLSGRVGLWLTKKFDKFSGRAVTDNSCYSRLWEWLSQQMLTHLVRSMVLRASLGADMFIINIYQGDPNQFNPFYKMLDKGIIHIPKRDDILSVS
ncbi:MAG TPA: hypothetical protein ENH82_06535, partial [bacterium]|nr:hypothetical protein [bacterium]